MESSQSEADARSPKLTGSWERAGRSPAAAAVFGLLGIGMLYMHAQSLLVVGATLVTGGIQRSGDFFADLAAASRLLRLPVQLSLVLSQVFFMLVPVSLLVRRWHTSEVRHYLRLRRVPSAEIVLAVLATLLFLPASAWTSEQFVRWVGIPRKLIAIEEHLFSAGTIPEYLWLVLVVAITPAVCEEILFRGYAQRTLERRIGWKAIPVIGVFFGLYHMQPLGLLQLSALGFLFGFLFYRSRSLLPAMAAHFTNNVVLVTLLYLTSNGFPANAGGWMDADVAIAGLLILFPVLVAYDRLARYRHLRAVAGSGRAFVTGESTDWVGPPETPSAPPGGRHDASAGGEEN